MNDELDFLDALTIFSVFLQIRNYEDNLKEVDNNYIIKKIEKIVNKQDIIIKQQNDIIEQLKKLEK